MEIYSVLDVPQTQTVPICKEFFLFSSWSVTQQEHFHITSRKKSGLQRIWRLIV